MAAGVLGVPGGAWLATRLRRVGGGEGQGAAGDPLLCAFALLASAPLVFLALVAVDVHVGLAYTLIFFGELAVNLTWAVVADVILVRAGLRNRPPGTPRIATRKFRIYFSTGAMFQ